MRRQGDDGLPVHAACLTVGEHDHRVLRRREAKLHGRHESQVPTPIREPDQSRRQHVLIDVKAQI